MSRAGRRLGEGGLSCLLLVPLSEFLEETIDHRHGGLRLVFDLVPELRSTRVPLYNHEALSYLNEPMRHIISIHRASFVSYFKHYSIKQNKYSQVFVCVHHIWHSDAGNEDIIKRNGETCPSA